MGAATESRVGRTSASYGASVSSSCTSNADAASENRMIEAAELYGRSGSSISSTVANSRSTSSERWKFSRTLSCSCSPAPFSVASRNGFESE